MRLKKTKTNRGFRLIEFNDCYGEACSLQKSSLADADAIWLGVNEAKNHHVTHLPLSPRMIGAFLGLITAFVCFFGAYIYCIASYGFLFGFGLGWLPSGILAMIVGTRRRQNHSNGCRDFGSGNCYSRENVRMVLVGLCNRIRRTNCRGPLHESTR